jgi:hypothetical protein
VPGIRGELYVIINLDFSQVSSSSKYSSHLSKVSFPGEAFCDRIIGRPTLKGYLGQALCNHSKTAKKTIPRTSSRILVHGTLACLLDQRCILHCILPDETKTV